MNESLKKKITAIKAAAMNLGCMGMNPEAIIDHMAQILGIINTANSILADIENEEKESAENGR